MRLDVRNLIVGLLAAVVAGCGGGGGFAPEDDGSTPTTSNVATITLTTSSPQLYSGDESGVTITAVVKDDDNNLLAGETVRFSTDSGDISVSQGTSDTSGQAIATLTTGGDEANRSITVTAIAGSVTETVSIPVTGTNITISGQSSLVLNDSTALTFTLKDYFGDGLASKTLAVSSANGNGLSAATVTTDTSGQATVTVTGDNAGNDTITVTGQGAVGVYALSVSGDDFSFTTPTSNGTEVDLLDVQTITVTWEQNGVPQAGETIDFAATRGTLSASSAVTNGAGQASVTISSNNAGLSLVTASVDGGPSASREIEFIATTPATLDLQSNLATVSRNGGQATITATVLDANSNRVKNQRVNFLVTDVTGGYLSVASDITDSTGQASTVYTSGAAASSTNGVVITATVAGTGIDDTVNLTVGGTALFITLGTGNTVLEPTVTTYSLPYTVYVKDASGGPVANVEVSLTAIPRGYYKGYYVFVDPSWTPVYTVIDDNGTPGDATDDFAVECDNEDVDTDGQLDAGEDTNSDDLLTPANPVTLSVGTVTTGADGSASFALNYPQEYATWTVISLKARAIVSGTEALAIREFQLPASAEDLADEEVSPPGNPSPFGTASLCTDAS